MNTNQSIINNDKMIKTESEPSVVVFLISSRGVKGADNFCILYFFIFYIDGLTHPLHPPQTFISLSYSRDTRAHTTHQSIQCTQTQHSPGRSSQRVQSQVACSHSWPLVAPHFSGPAEAFPLTPPHTPHTCRPGEGPQDSLPVMRLIGWLIECVRSIDKLFVCVVIVVCV